MAKYFFENTEDPEFAYTKDYFIEEMKERGITEMQVYPAVQMVGESFAYCTEFQTSFEKSENECGRFCPEYKPRNGKSGRCRFSKNCYEPADTPIVLRLKKRSPDSNYRKTS